MISLEEAKKLLLKKITELNKSETKWESLSLWEAGGRILAEDIVAKENVPSFDRSPVDGYALLAEDTLGASEDKPLKLKIIDTIAAGSASEKELSSGHAMQIFTGAPLPEGANCVIKEEEVKIIDSHILIKRQVTSGESIAYKGEDIKINDFLLPKGTIISSVQMGILATLGLDSVKVFAKPEIGIFSTGSELVEIDKDLNHGQLRVSNIHTIGEIIREAGASPVNLGVVKDDIDEVITIYDRAQELDLPLVISTGGTATGDYDLIKEAMDIVADERLFDKIAVRPGAPAVTSVRGRQVLIGLSGNPAGAAVASYVLVYPLIKSLLGAYNELEQKSAQLSQAFNRRGGLRGFIWANYYDKDGNLYVTPQENQFCGALKTFSQSNCLVEVPQGRVDFEKGRLVKIWKLPV